LLNPLTFKAKIIFMVKNIPVRPHVKAFLLGEFGLEPIAAHSKGLVGSALNCVAQRIPYNLTASKLPSGGCTIQIKLPLSLKHYKITPDNAKKLGYHFEKLFQQALIQFIKGQVAITDNDSHAIKTFYALYNINPDDYDLESARKCWRDYKESQYRKDLKKVA
jgi:hypothetical protein